MATVLSPRAFANASSGCLGHASWLSAMWFACVQRCVIEVERREWNWE
ncbi:hypothetical protein [Streptomyces sp. NPDC056549]